MADNYNMEQSRARITEVRETIENKRQQLDTLKEQKEALLDVKVSLDSSNLDATMQKTIMDSIDGSLEQVEQKSYEISKDANQNLRDLEKIRQDVEDDLTDTEKTQRGMDKTKQLLDKLGLGKSLDSGLNKLDDHRQNAEGLKEEVISAMADLEAVYRALDVL